MELDIERIKAEARAITGSNLLANIGLTNVTTTRIGGYNARPYSEELHLSEGLRTSEVKGVWRWWLRATLAGALWDLEKEPKVTVIRKMVNEILGSTKSASKFTLSSHIYSQVKEASDLREIPRMKLILINRGDESQEEFRIRSSEEKSVYPPNSLRVGLSVYERAGKPLDQTTKRLALGTLLLALLLNGTGAITRRGFGHFQVTVEECPDELTDFKNSIKAINMARSKNEMQTTLEELFSKVLMYAKGSLTQANVLGELAPKSPRLPPFPLLSCDSAIFRLAVVHVNARDETTLLGMLGKASTKAGWKGSLGLNFRRVGGVLDSWILGLPREVKGTGYVSKVERRSSAISLAPMKRLDHGFLVTVYGFLSSDWPIGDLRWKSSRSKLLQVENMVTSDFSKVIDSINDFKMRDRIKECLEQRGEARIKCAFSLAFDLIVRQLGGGQYELQRR